MLHMICTRLHPGHLSVCVGDSLRCSEEVVKISNCTFNAMMMVIITINDKNICSTPITQNCVLTCMSVISVTKLTIYSLFRVKFGQLFDQDLISLILTCICN